jgi:hypothetical protein
MVSELFRSGSFELYFDVTANTTGYRIGYRSDFLMKSKYSERLVYKRLEIGNVIKGIDAHNTYRKEILGLTVLPSNHLY